MATKRNLPARQPRPEEWTTLRLVLLLRADSDGDEAEPPSKAGGVDDIEVSVVAVLAGKLL